MNTKQVGLVVTLALAAVLPLGSISAVENDSDAAKPGIGFSFDGELMPIVKVAPFYPVEAQKQRVEGYVLVEFVVTERGSVAEPFVVESDPSRLPWKKKMA